MRVVLSVFAIVAITSQASGRAREFPPNFLFGCATSSYQVEGAWNVSGKGENIWDRMTHSKPESIKDRSNGNVACDSYHLYKRDVQMLKEMGVDFYRFSLSWSRILPTGFSNKINPDGINYYNNLINELLANGITPYVTMYHWDLPQPLQDLGGWISPMIIQYFQDYAKVVLDNFGDRVKNWLTFNEPKEICVFGYGQDSMAPGLNLSGIADYICGHNVLKAHARVYHMFDEEYRPIQGGHMTLTFSSAWIEPADNSTANVQASQKVLAFGIGWFAHPVFSAEGDYPAVMKQAILTKSLLQGFSQSRLPSFTAEEIDDIRGTADYFGVNHYTSGYARLPQKSLNYPQPSFFDDLSIDEFGDDTWKTGASSWLRVVPWGFRKLLNWVKDSYNSPEIIIFENGFCDLAGLNDVSRIDYFRQYMNTMLDAMEDGVRITGYTAWSLMDAFEWVDGYKSYFGLYDVDFSSPQKTRTAKQSAKFYRDVIKNRVIG